MATATVAFIGKKGQASNFTTFEKDGEVDKLGKVLFSNYDNVEKTRKLTKIDRLKTIFDFKEEKYENNNSKNLKNVKDRRYFLDLISKNEILYMCFEQYKTWYIAFNHDNGFNELFSLRDYLQDEYDETIYYNTETIEDIFITNFDLQIFNSSLLLILFAAFIFNF